MSTVNIGCVAVVATFAELFSPGERASALRMYERQAEGEPPELQAELAAEYGELCQQAINRVLPPRWPQLTTVQTHGAFGYAEHHKDCFRLGCDVAAEEFEAERACVLLGQPEMIAQLQVALEDVTQNFLDHTLPKPLFADFACSFQLLTRPRPD